MFSDSLLLISNDDSKSSAASIVGTIQWILEQATLKKIPIKGAIAYGEQTADFDKSLHFGRPLIDAFDLQGELLLYGVVLHHTMEKYLIDGNLISILENKDIYKWPTPMKSGKVTHYIIDWINTAFKPKETKETIPLLYCNVSGTPRKYVDNTFDFMNWLDKRKAELAKDKK